MATDTTAAPPLFSSSSDSSANGFSLQVTVYIAPKDVPKFMEAYKPVFDMVTGEPECVFFEVYQSPENPGTISWVENWTASVEWFTKEQLPKECFKTYLAITEPMYIKPREAKILNRMGRDWLVIKDKQYSSEN